MNKVIDSKNLEELTVEELFEKIEKIFQKQSPSNWVCDHDILHWFDLEKANKEKMISFTPSIEALKKNTTEEEMLAHERSVLLPLRQALYQVIEFIGNKQIPDGEWYNSPLIFLSTKDIYGETCCLEFGRIFSHESSLVVYRVASDDVWGPGTRVLFDKEKETKPVKN
ncbi:MAG: hypothetical protein PHC89_02975 [Candidatus Pacebacteria bacterium]|nr:hypothetical protein [Candidatus Paceibacterota bacterium]